MNQAFLKLLLDGTVHLTNANRQEDFTDEDLCKLREVYKKRPYLNSAEAALLIGCSRRTVYRMIKDKKLVGYKRFPGSPYTIDVKMSRLIFPI